jgi:hypothetical protein
MKDSIIKILKVLGIGLLVDGYVTGLYTLVFYANDITPGIPEGDNLFRAILAVLMYKAFQTFGIALVCMPKKPDIYWVLLPLVMFFASCKKEEVKPAPAPTGPKTYLYVYRVIGYERLDTATVHINGKFAYNATNRGYHEAFAQGDTVDFYFSGKRKIIYKQITGTEPALGNTTPKNEAGRAAGIPIGLAECNFGIWRDWNNGLTVLYFYPDSNRIKARIIIE